MRMAEEPIAQRIPTRSAGTEAGPHRSRYGIACFATPSLLVGLLWIASTSYGDALSERLADLRRELGPGGPPSTSVIVGLHERLLAAHPAPEDRGRIYADLAEVLCNTGMKDPEAIILATKDALACPLDPSVSMRVHVAYGDALQVKNRGVTDDALRAVRGDIAKVYLEGVKVGLDGGAPEEKLPLLPVEILNIRGDEPRFQKAIREHDEAAANEIRKHANELLERRNALEGQVVYLYTRRPYDTDELKRIAADALKNDSAVQRIVAKVDAGILKREEAGRDSASGALFMGISQPATAQATGSNAPPAAAPTARPEKQR